MDFIKKNYEKIILGLVLFGLIGVLVVMWFVIQGDQQKMSDLKNQILSGSTKPLPELDLSVQSDAVLRLKLPSNLDLETTNKLFNPLEWQRKMDGTLVKREGLGTKAASVTTITPLYLIVSLDSVETNELGARYSIGVERQASPNPGLRHKIPRYVSADDRKKDIFTLLDIKGPVDDPDELVLRMADTGEVVSISKSKSYDRVEGYTADIRYDPENRKFAGRRVGMMISFGGEDYIIVAIDKDEVILSAQSNLKKYTLRYAP